MNLQISPDAPALVHAVAATVLVLHIGGGSIGIVSGAAALALRKGGRLHRIAGDVFFVSMLTMAAIGASVSPLMGHPLDSTMGVFAFYLVATGWATVMRKAGAIGRFERGAFAVAFAGAVTALAFAVQAARSPTGLLGGYPPAGYYVVASLLGFAATLDLKLILRGGITGAARIARHLWRMCTALWIAAGSLFLGQSQLFPAPVRQSFVLFVPELLILALLIFWLLRVGFTKAFKEPAAA